MSRVFRRVLFVLCALALSCLNAEAAGATRPISTTISFDSVLLSAFWHKRIHMDAVVYVPARCVNAQPACPVLFHLPGYGGTLASAASQLRDYINIGERHHTLAMAQVFLNPSFMGGFQYFTDSENYGPWNSALTQELIPYLEQRFHFGGDAHGRFLVGGSSGGWAVLWLQVSNPQFFNGVWAISPDPSDFRYFYQVDVTPGSKENFYYDARGRARPFTRGGDTSLKTLMQTIDDDPSRGGVVSSYEFSWSPKGADGLPMRFFDRATGALNQETLRAWKNFDIHEVLAADLPNLRVQLDGKLNLYVGTLDTFFYDQPGSAMCRFLKNERFHANCHVIPGRTHGNVVLPYTLYPRGLHYYAMLHSMARWHAWLSAEARSASAIPFAG